MMDAGMSARAGVTSTFILISRPDMVLACKWFGSGYSCGRRNHLSLISSFSFLLPFPWTVIFAGGSWRRRICRVMTKEGCSSLPCVIHCRSAPNQPPACSGSATTAKLWIPDLPLNLQFIYAEIRTPYQAHT